MSELLRICPFCKDEGRASRLTPSPTSTTTCMAGSPGYFDDAGKWVPGYDPNIRARDYWCSNGHRFAVISQQGRPDEIDERTP